MDDALHLAPRPSGPTSTSAGDGRQVPASLIVTMVGLVIATAGGVACVTDRDGGPSCP